MGRRKKEVQANPENAEVSQGTQEVSQVGNVLTPSQMRREMARSIRNQLKQEYAEMFEPIPDRTTNLLKIGIPSIDHLLGGGLPRGQMVHIYGGEGVGKTSLALQIAASTLSQGSTVYYGDLENSLDKKYASQLKALEDQGLDYGRKQLSGERSLDMIEKGVRNNAWDMVIIDSVTALAPQAVINGSNEDKFVAEQARMLSQALMKLNLAAVNSDTIIVWINQLRSNIQTFGKGKPYTTTGGKALPFYANINLFLQRIGSITIGSGENQKIIGQEVKIRVDKNKIASPMQEVVGNLIYGEGYPKSWDLVSTAINEKIIKVSGSWYQLDGTNIGQGITSVIEKAKNEPAFLDDLEARIYGGQVEPGSHDVVEESTVAINE